MILVLVDIALMKQHSYQFAIVIIGTTCLVKLKIIVNHAHHVKCSITLVYIMLRLSNQFKCLDHGNWLE